jgi:glucosamine--fructose-6-phosphate aminotransferase (isomerizing)
VKLGGIDEYKDIIARARRIIIFAVGSAYYGALAVRNTLEELVDLPISIELASDFPDWSPPIFRDDVCCFVSFSGENPQILDLLEFCKTKKALCIGFTNKVGSTVAANTDCGVYLHAGYEMSVSCTKAYTSEVVALLMFALVVSEDSLKAQPRREEIIEALQLLPDNVAKALETSKVMAEVAEAFKSQHNFLCMGRGNQTATCLEGAMKLKETALVHSEGIHLGELKHGPLALVDEEMPVLVVCTKDKRSEKSVEVDEMYPKVKSSLQQVLARKGRPIVIANDEGEDSDDALWGEIFKKVSVPYVLDCLQTVVNIVPLQLLAYHLGVVRGQDPDREPIGDL